MKSKNSKLMYVSAAVLAAGAVAGVNTQNAHAAEVEGWTFNPDNQRTGSP